MNAPQARIRFDHVSLEFPSPHGPVKRSASPGRNPKR